MSISEFELSAYEALVDQLARSASGEVYANTGTSHAKVVVNKLFDATLEKLAVFSGGLSEKVHNKEMYEKLIDRIGADAIRIVVSDANAPSANETLIRHLVKKGVDVRQYPEIGAHLVISDESGFRMEHDLKNMKALFAFGGEQPKSLLQSFERIWVTSDTVKLPESA